LAKTIPDLTIEKAIKSASKADQISSKKLQQKVREFEEISKNKFIAFVDDGPDSLDVSLTFHDNGSTIINHECDCVSTLPFCTHQLAVLLYMKEGTTTSSTSSLIKKIRKVKLSPIEILLDSIEYLELKKWLLDELQSNKELQLKFKNQFDKESSKPTAAEITNFGEVAIKTVIGKKKWIEPAQLVYIFDIWNKYIDSQLDYFYQEITTLKGVQIFGAIYNFHLKLQSEVLKSTTRISTNQKKFEEKIEAYLMTQSEDKIHTHLSLYVEQRIQKKENLQPVIERLMRVAKHLSIEKIKQILNKILGYKQTFGNLDEKFMIQFLDFVTDNQLFKTFYNDLPHKKYFNEYNLKYLKALIEIGMYDLAIKLCNESISNNYYETYNNQYYKVLLTVYEKSGKQEDADKMRIKLFNLDPSYQLYQSIYENLKDQNTKILFELETLNRPLRRTSGDYAQTLELKIGLWASKEMYSKIIDKLETPLSLYLSLPYLEKLYQENKKLLILRIMKNILADWNWRETDYQETRIMEFIAEHYTSEEIENSVGFFHLPAYVKMYLRKKYTS